MKYTGFDIRQEQIDANNEQKAICKKENPLPLLPQVQLQGNGRLQKQICKKKNLSGWKKGGVIV